MLKTLSSLINWTSTTPEHEWNTWIEWQKQQATSHYEKSEIFQYFLTHNIDFQAPRYSCINGSNSRLYVYCFGDFAALLVNPTGGGNVVEYFDLLLKVYDTCKGHSRRLKGDPSGITLIREVVHKRSLGIIQEHNFNQYNYDYSMIHAHTVAQYSLSTLIMRLASHYMSFMTTRGNYYPIMLDICLKVYNKSTFGEPRVIAGTSTSTSIPVQVPTKPIHEDSRPLSWPRDNSSCIRCKICSRVTENIWGKFDACLDCHLKRVCSECGHQAVIIGVDSLPRCYYHQSRK